MFIMKQSCQDFDDDYDYVKLMTLHNRELLVNFRPLHGSYKMYYKRGKAQIEKSIFDVQQTL